MGCSQSSLRDSHATVSYISGSATAVRDSAERRARGRVQQSVTGNPGSELSRSSHVHAEARPPQGRPLCGFYRSYQPSTRLLAFTSQGQREPDLSSEQSGSGGGDGDDDDGGPGRKRMR
jgi:hypothetical protein